MFPNSRLQTLTFTPHLWQIICTNSNNLKYDNLKVTNSYRAHTLCVELMTKMIGQIQEIFARQESLEHFKSLACFCLEQNGEYLGSG